MMGEKYIFKNISISDDKININKYNMNCFLGTWNPIVQSFHKHFIGHNIYDIDEEKFLMLSIQGHLLKNYKKLNYKRYSLNVIPQILAKILLIISQ